MIKEIQLPNAQRDIELLMIGYAQDVPGVIQSALDQIEDSFERLTFQDEEESYTFVNFLTALYQILRLHFEASEMMNLHPEPLYSDERFDDAVVKLAQMYELEDSSVQAASMKFLFAFEHILNGYEENAISWREFLFDGYEEVRKHVLAMQLAANKKAIDSDGSKGEV
ncbi:hypothetical protein ACTJNK_13725 [Achromobacter anxifer]